MELVPILAYPRSIPLTPRSWGERLREIPRVVTILRALDDLASEATVWNLCQFTGISRATLFRILRGLRVSRLLGQEGRGFGQSGRLVLTPAGVRAAQYARGLEVLLLGGEVVRDSAPSQSVEEAHPLMEEIIRRFSVRDDEEKRS